MAGELHWGRQMYDMEQSPELNETPEKPEGSNAVVYRSVYAHSHMMDSGCIIAALLNDDVLRDHQIHQTSHA